MVVQRVCICVVKKGVTMGLMSKRVVQAFFGVVPVVLGCSGAPGTAQTHPLDGLAPAEYQAVTAILRDAGLADETTLYPSIDLVEPDKAAVLDWEPGDKLARRALVHFSSDDGYQFARVNITDGVVEASGDASGQPPLLFQEILDTTTLVIENPDMVAGLAKRGLTPDDVYCLPLTAGNFFTDVYTGTRLMKAPCYVLPTGSNFYAKPVEGLVPLVNLDTGEVLEVVDTGVVPIAGLAHGYTQDEIAEGAALRPVGNPVKFVQEGGPNYTISGSQIEWDMWRFHMRVDKRPGLVVSNIDVKDGDEWRSVLYQAHLSEVFVPYMDPTEGWYWRTYMDSGEYGFGLFLTPLVAGVDCPDHATFLPAVINDDAGNPLEIPDAICVFERITGDPAWRHFEIFAQGPDTYVPAEGRPETELVVRTASEVGNYDYLIDYRFKQNGDIYIKIGSTGLDAVKGVASQSMLDATAAADTQYGELIAPNLVAAYHDHYFNFRLDFDVDQRENHFGVTEIVPGEVADDSPRRSLWTTKHTMPDSELDARFRNSTSAPRFFHVMNMNGEGPLGYKPGYMIHHGSNAYGPFDFENDPPFKRNGYIEYSVWNTVYDPAQRYAGGEYAMQSTGEDTLPAWVKADKPLHGQDIVTWYTAGFHHIPRVEDWPVMTTEWKTIHIMPHNFFAQNPAMTIPNPVSEEE